MESLSIYRLANGHRSKQYMPFVYCQTFVFQFDSVDEQLHQARSPSGCHANSPLWLKLALTCNKCRFRPWPPTHKVANWKQICGTYKFIVMRKRITWFVSVITGCLSFTSKVPGSNLEIQSYFTLDIFVFKSSVKTYISITLKLMTLVIFLSFSLTLLV